MVYQLYNYKNDSNFVFDKNVEFSKFFAILLNTQKLIY